MASAHARRLASEIHSNSDVEPGATDHRNTPATPPPQSVQLPDSRRGKEYISPVPPAATIAAIGWCRSARRFVLNPAISGDKSVCKGVTGKAITRWSFARRSSVLMCSHALANLQSGGAIASYPSGTLWPQVGRGATGELRLLSTLTSNPVSAKS